MLVTANQNWQRLDNEHLDLKFNSETLNTIANDKTYFLPAKNDSDVMFVYKVIGHLESIYHLFCG